ncbi:hypothetical protein AVEN_214102-1 [Araneus ventricosus]|uniref:Uncharacterized protein n=1 Tax=Araneus ventricosus TaxID=182803 RepID=A0A4Y2C841_ARAVE|nr:hypothetical protein AVEN_214102-1 [Araneus ventricosus]
MHGKWGSRVCSSLREDEEGEFTFPGIPTPYQNTEGKVKRGRQQEGNRSGEDSAIFFPIKVSLFAKNTAQALMYNEASVSFVGMKDVKTSG